MPFVTNEKSLNTYNESDKAKDTIKNLSAALKEEENTNSILKKHRILLGVLNLLLLIFLVGWGFFFQDNNQYKEEYLIKNNLSLVHTDSLHKLQRTYKQIENEDLSSATSVSEMLVVYSVQIGAYTNFSSTLISEDLAHLETFQDQGYNKFSIGKFTNYKETAALRDDMKKLGFKDCFIIAKSYGEKINITEALKLSDET